MKRILLIILIAGITPAFASTLADSAKIELVNAKVMVNAHSKAYNPQKAYAIFTKYASMGNAEAMNGLGNCYNTGTGTSVNIQDALNWFNKSADAGYSTAYYNLGLMYKNGNGVAQDFGKAYTYFSKGADLNNRMCIYAKGYLNYKGLGVTQNYQLAAQLFKKGAVLRDDGCYYMLGLCYRNGYGISVNTDSARYWLTKAANLGDKRAKKELVDATPENADIKTVPDLQGPATTDHPKVDLKSGFKQINNHISLNDVAGEYNGYIVKFDWSGKHIISEDGLKVTLTQKKKELGGEWQESKQEKMSFSGTATDTALVFINTSNTQVDHYHVDKPLLISFENSHLNLLQSKDTVFLSGTLRLYSPETKEPQKPEFIMLMRTGAKEHFVFDNDPDTLKDDSLHFVAYPNPFISSLSLRYTLKKPAMVNVMVSNEMSGIIVYHSQAQMQQAGDYTAPITFNGQPGHYIVTLQYGKRIKSAIVFKQ